MKLQTLVAASLAGVATAVVPRDYKGQIIFGPHNLQANHAPHAVDMAAIMDMKLRQHATDMKDGMFGYNKYKKQPPTACVRGRAGEYACDRVDMKGFLRHQDMHSRTRTGNDIWGWTSPDGREFGLVGQSDGTAFVEVLKDGNLQYIGRLDTQTGTSLWRDVKVIGHHAYIGSEAEDHGMQVFDLTKLLKVDPKHPETFDKALDLAAHFDKFGSSHNIVANEETETIFAVGTSRWLPCRGGLWMIDVSNPRRPQDNGCVYQDGYVHDAQCVIYKGPDRRFRGHEICFNYNENALTIVDITVRAIPKQISRTTYNGAAYTHQGWLATEDHRYLLLDDELDEVVGSEPAEDGKTTTYIVDVTDLTYPVFRGIYKSPIISIDHNQYVIDGISYQSNYGSGLRIVNVTSIAEDDTGAGFEEIGSFDVYPEDDEVGSREFHGSWSVYPFFKSGHLLLNSIERGVYSLKLKN
ncbi:hypothetical protein VHEMI10304 [[Torrubiella] hemipterigena]|uniref:Regulatory P domain-containing protein n=1 Tax=[Torrubiella] hemipterigena TaxID=1531966 RepID=A0A0A1TT33_9HYPO|nr:hypothetical protein VHEMI10304 [[Torrubiella] hemipterigena]